MWSKESGIIKVLFNTKIVNPKISIYPRNVV